MTITQLHFDEDGYAHIETKNGIHLLHKDTYEELREHFAPGEKLKKADDELVEAMFWAADPAYEKCYRVRGLAHSASLYEAIRAALAVVRQDRQKARAAPLAKDGPVTPSTHGGRADGYRRAMNRTDKQNHQTTTGE